jgi:sialic acid synthase
MTSPKIIGEIGCNHKGDFEIAKKMIVIAEQFCKVDFVKFQKRNPKECLPEQLFNAPHPVQENAFGESYGQHREFLEFNRDQHQELKDFCESVGIGYSCSVWDVTSAKDIISLNPAMIKVPSACNSNQKILGYLCDHFPGEIHISMGMTNHHEEDDLLGFLIKKRRNKDVVLYACTSGYPVPPEDVCLLEITRLKNSYENDVKAIGFSGHHVGVSIDIAASVLGAQWIERHYTLDRTWKGTDHAASLEPEGLRRVARDTKVVHKALTYKNQEILEIEELQRKKLKELYSEY